MKLTDHSVLELSQKALQIKISILKALNAAKSGHLGGSIDITEILTSLYFYLINHNPKDPQWPDRDRVILSAGHLAPALYATLAHSGYFEIKELQTLRKLGSRLQGHPSLHAHLPGIETSSGSLGQGLGIAIGIALAANYRSEKYKIVTILGDGELQEGSVWESAMSAAHYNLSNIIAIIDRNRVQIDGNTEEVMALEPLAYKWRSFGWNVLECDGNNIKDFISTYRKAEKTETVPTAIIANTKMGYGIQSIENNYKWHGQAPDDTQLKQFIKELTPKGSLNE